MELRELSDEEFESFVNTYKLSSMYQTVEYANVMSNHDYKTIYVGLIDEKNNIVAASLLLIEQLSKFKYAYAPRGFLIDYNNLELLKEFTEKIKNYLKNLHVMAVKITPLIYKTKYTNNMTISLDNPQYDTIIKNLKNLKYYHLGYNNKFEALKPRFVAIKELNTNIDEMFNQLDKDTKSKINLSDFAGIRIYKADENNLEFVYENLREKRKNSMEYVKDLYSNFNKNNKIEVFLAQLETKVYLVNTQMEYQKQINVCGKVTDELFKNQGKSNNELISKKIKEDNKLAILKNQLIYATNLLKENPNGVIIASIMAIKHKDCVYLTLDGELAKYTHFCPKQLLIWKLIEKYATEGYKYINLGGMTNPREEKENKYKIINELKLSFNSDCIEYAGDFELVTHKLLYSMYRNSSPIRKMIFAQPKK